MASEMEKWMERIEMAGITVYVYTCPRCGRKIRGWTKTEALVHAINHERACARKYEG